MLIKPTVGRCIGLIQADEECPQNNYCAWMPYQQGQAAKAESLEKQLADKK